MFLYGAVMLALLFTPWKEWAANHSIASFVSATDQRAGNTINTPVDMPISVVGSCVMMFGGLWVGLLVPRVLKNFKAGYAQTTSAAWRESCRRSRCCCRSGRWR